MRKNLKRVLALLMATTMSVGLMAGCSSSSSSETSEATVEKEETAEVAAETVTESVSAQTGNFKNTVDGDYIYDKLICSNSGDGGTFDPFAMGGWGQAIVNDLMYQRLADLDPYGVLHYCMLKSVEEIDDMHYNLELWDNIYDTEGHHITSSDVVWSFDMAFSKGRGGALSKFDHFEVVDDYNLIWVCSAPFTAGEFDKQISIMQIISQEAYESRGNTGMSADPCGTGPYILTEYVPGSIVRFEANEDYWMRNLPDEAKTDIFEYDAQNVREIEYQIILDSSTRAIALEMGTIDIADQLDTIDVDSMKDDYSVITMTQTAPMAIVFNCDPDSICSDVRIRQAICYAIDAEAIADGVSVAAEAASCLLPLQVDTPQEWIDEPYFEYDPDKAQELLDEAGYNGELIHVIYNTNGAKEEIAILMESQLKEAGFNVDIEAMDSSLYDSAQYDPSAYDIKIGQFGGGYYIANVMTTNFVSANMEQHIGGGRNQFYVVDDELEELIAIENVDNSVDNILALGDRINEQCYGYSLYTYADQTLCSSELDGDSMYGGKISPNSALPSGK